MQGSCVADGNFTPKAMAYDWIAGDIYVAARVNRMLQVLRLSEERGTGYMSVTNSTGAAKNMLVQMTINPLNGYV